MERICCYSKNNSTGDRSCPVSNELLLAVLGTTRLFVPYSSLFIPTTFSMVTCLASLSVSCLLQLIRFSVLAPGP